MWRKQLTLFLSPRKIPKQFLQSYLLPPGSCSTFSSSCQLEVIPLKSRSLIRLRGSEGQGRDLLQGLITNDIAHLEQKPSIFTLLLNHQGRVLFDAVVSLSPEEKSPGGGDSKAEEPSILIECDTPFRSKLVSHLKLYRLKRKVDIEAEDKLSVWVVCDG